MKWDKMSYHKLENEGKGRVFLEEIENKEYEKIKKMINLRNPNATLKCTLIHILIMFLQEMR